jgi:dTDP-4-amino-4,6-dideoxygalactose transaminase
LGECSRFEEEWAHKIGTKYALLMCGGGTAALVCALAGIGIGPGDEVLVPAYTWMATATSVLAVGSIPVLTEVDETLAMDPADVERKVTPQTKAIIPVHMIGRPAHMERLCAVARKHGLKVVEDSCQCDGGSFQGRRTGSWGDVGAFSFNYFKIISTGGEGGCLVTNDRKIYETAFIYHDSGSAFRPKAAEMSVPIFVAHQFRADEVLGALGRAQMARLDGILADLRRNRKRFEAELDGVGCLRVAPNNDAEGDCGVGVLFQFEEEARAAAFAKVLGPNCGYHCIDHNKHVYTNWTPLRQKRACHHPDMNPFNFAKNLGLRMDYSEQACPKTLDLLRRSYCYLINPDWTEAEITQRMADCRKAATQILNTATNNKGTSSCPVKFVFPSARGTSTKGRIRSAPKCAPTSLSTGS